MNASTDTITDLEAIEGLAVLDGLSNEAYHGQKSHISRSTAHRFSGPDGGRAQRRAEVDRKPLFEGNASTTFGSIVDRAFELLISGARWQDALVSAPESVLASDGSRRGKAFTEWKRSIPSGAMECSAVDVAKVSDIIDSLMEHDAARELIEAVCGAQTSVFWTDEDGHKRKARADGVTKDLWFDLKTTTKSWSTIKHSFIEYGYGWQQSWYGSAARVAGWPEFSMPFICVQTWPPFNVKVYTIPDAYAAICRDEIRETLNRIRLRRETGVYLDQSYGKVEELSGLVF